MNIVNWTDVGVFPLQDHEENIDEDLRHMMVGARIEKYGEAEDNPADLMMVVANDRDKGTIGDVHPWLFWQTKDRYERGMGAWSMSWFGMTQPAESNGGGPTTGPKQGGGMRPVYDGDKHEQDTRMVVITPSYPKCFSMIPNGTMALAMPLMKEQKQETILAPVDNRLFAVNYNGPGECGTLVVDLQPDLQPCMNYAESDKKKTPGRDGRHARLQSVWRVVALESTMSGLDKLGSSNNFNGVAWNCTLSQQDEIAGLGMAYFRLAVGGSTKTGPITGTRLPPRQQYSFASNSGDSPGGGVSFGGGGSGGGGGEPEEFDQKKGFSGGVFKGGSDGKYGVALMSDQACGPFHGGHTHDKHMIGLDRDWSNVQSGHLSTNAYFFDDVVRDGPMYFEGTYPNPPPFPLLSRVHLTWDPGLTHKSIGKGNDGMWRWYCEVPISSNGGDRDKLPPKIPGPTTGNPTPTPGAPTTPGPTPPGPGSKPAPTGPKTPSRVPPPPPPAPAPWGPKTANRDTLPPVIEGPKTPRDPTKPPRGGGWRTTEVLTEDDPSANGTNSGGVNNSPYGGNFFDQNDMIYGDTEVSYAPSYYYNPPSSYSTIGDATTGSVDLFEVMHPLSSGFAKMVFRPQRMVRGYPNFIHNQNFDADYYREVDDTTRPHVLGMSAWGAQNSSGEWDYAEPPYSSRMHGGLASGGILFTPPQHLIDDYFGLGDGDTSNSLTTSYVTCAPNTAFALGRPNLDGGLEAKSIIIGQATSGNEQLTIYQLNSSRVPQLLLQADVSSSGEIHVKAGGNNSMRIPRGTTAQRSGSPVGGEIRLNTDVTSSVDTVEYYDAQATSWKQLGVASDHGGLTGLSDDDHTQYLLVSGSRAMTGAINMGGNKVTNMGWATGAGDAIEVVQAVATFVAKVGSTMTGNLGVNVSAVENVHVADTVRADTAFNLNGTDGTSDTINFTDQGGSTHEVTIAGGIITSWTVA